VVLSTHTHMYIYIYIHTYIYIYIYGVAVLCAVVCSVLDSFRVLKLIGYVFLCKFLCGLRVGLSWCLARREILLLGRASFCFDVILVCLHVFRAAQVSIYIYMHVRTC
jgi:hypothetical protein